MNELLELLKSYPNLPVVVRINNDIIDKDYDYSVYENLVVDIRELTIFDTNIWYTYEEIKNRILDNGVFDLENKFYYTCDKELNEKVDNYIKENYTFKKYICISIV